MSKNIFFLVLFAIIINPVDAKTADYSKLGFFGDSLSDTGNLSFLGQFSEYPHYKNRISDGPLIADLVANSLNLSSDASEHLIGKQNGYNFAIAGGSVIGLDAGSLESQIDAYLNLVNQKADPNALYFLMIGGNDIIAISANITDKNTADGYIREIATTFRSQLNRLISAGARSILVTNVPNIGSLPAALKLKALDENIVDRALANTKAYNNGLYYVLDEYEKRKDINLELFDFFSAFEYLVNNYKDFGFRSNNTACLSDYYLVIEPDCAQYGLQSSVFFDGIHLSSSSNALLAAELLKKLPALPQ